MLEKLVYGEIYELEIPYYKEGIYIGKLSNINEEMECLHVVDDGSEISQGCAYRKSLEPNKNYNKCFLVESIRPPDNKKQVSLIALDDYSTRNNALLTNTYVVIELNKYEQEFAENLFHKAKSFINP